MNTIECAFEGRAAAKPELKTSPNGVQWCRVSIAVGRGDEVQWVSAVAFEDVAAHAAATIEKATTVYAEGTLRLSRWRTGKDGIERYGLEVLANKLIPLGQIGHRRPSNRRGVSSALSDAAQGFGAPAGNAQRDWQAPDAPSDVQR
jgi:single-stranded DNA-binding protein